jgi:hypothetical protein
LLIAYSCFLLFYDYVLASDKLCAVLNSLQNNEGGFPRGIDTF